MLNIKTRKACATLGIGVLLLLLFTSLRCPAPVFPSSNWFGTNVQNKGSAAAVRTVLEVVGFNGFDTSNFNTNNDTISLSVGITNTFIASGFAGAFARSNGITDQVVIEDLRGFEAEHVKAGVLANLVDMFPLSTRFNVTNYKSFFGSAWVTNQNAPTFSIHGANLNLTNGATLTVQPLTSNTIVIVMWTPDRAYDNAANLNTYQNFNFSFHNSSDTNGYYVGFDPSSGMRLWERGGAAWAYGGSAATAVNSNKVRMLKVGGYSTDPVHVLNRNVFALSSDGSGKHKMWMNTIPMIFNQDSPVTNYTSPVTNSSPVDTIKIGMDPTWTSFQFNGSFSNRNFIGYIESISIYNRADDTNIVNTSYRASRWLNHSDIETIYQSDSMIDVPLVSSTGYTNSPAWIVQSRDPYNRCWQNYSVGGSTITNMTNGLLWGRFPITHVSMLPRGKVKKIEIITDIGRNDVLISGRLPSNTFTDFTNLYAPYRELGAEITFLATHEVHPASASYSAVNNSNLSVWNISMMTNPVITRYVAEREYVSRDILNGTTDKIHLTSFELNRRFANLIQGLPWGTSIPPANPVAGVTFNSNFTNTTASTKTLQLAFTMNTGATITWTNFQTTEGFTFTGFLGTFSVVMQPNNVVLFSTNANNGTMDFSSLK